MRHKDLDEKMSVAATAKEMIEETMVYRHVKQPEAMKIVAESIGVRPGSLERLIRGRLVHIERIEGRIRAYALRKLEKEFNRLVSDYERARLIAERPDDPDLLLAKTAMEEARKALWLK